MPSFFYTPRWLRPSSNKVDTYKLPFFLFSSTYLLLLFLGQVYKYILYVLNAPWFLVWIWLSAQHVASRRNRRDFNGIKHLTQCVLPPFVSKPHVSFYVYFSFCTSLKTRYCTFKTSFISSQSSLQSHNGSFFLERVQYILIIITTTSYWEERCARLSVELVDNLNNNHLSGIGK